MMQPRTKWSRRWVCGAFLTVLAGSALAMQSDRTIRKHVLREVRWSERENLLRVQFICDGAFDYEALALESPPRVVVKMTNVSNGLSRSEWPVGIAGVRNVKVIYESRRDAILALQINLNRSLSHRTSAYAGILNIDFDTSTEGRTRAGSPARADARLNPIPAAAAPLPGGKITLDLRGVELGNVLRLLAKQNKVNIIAGPEVTGVVTVALNEVTLKEALDTILGANGYAYLRQGNTIVVKGEQQLGFSERATRVYRLKYAEANSIKEAITQVISEKAVVQVFTDAFTGLGQRSGTADATVVGAERGSGLTQRASTLIVSDTPQTLEQVDRLIAALDIPPRQVLIEAKLIELSPLDKRELGINWAKRISAEVYSETEMPSGDVVPFSARTPLRAGGAVTLGTLTVGRFATVLDYLRTSTRSRLLSNPRIIATDNVLSEISVGTSFPIPQINRGVGGQGDMVTFRYEDVKIALRVVPHVSGHGIITMKVNPVIEEITGSVEVGGSSAPITSVRTINTTVTLRDRETMVIGGLIKENRRESVEKVWLLGDIPLLGNLFRNSKLNSQQTDLVIFLTPQIVGE